MRQQKSRCSINCNGHQLTKPKLNYNYVKELNKDEVCNRKIT
jgi:hypothetical protein